MPSFVAQMAARAPTDSPDLARVLALPRRLPEDPNSARAEALVELMTRRLRRPDRLPGAACNCRALGRPRCFDRLNHSQAWILYEGGQMGGVVAQSAVGSGKTGAGILMPMVVPNIKRAGLFCPPGLVGQLEVEHEAMAEHFVVPSLVMPKGRGGRMFSGRPQLHVVPYSILQRPESSALLRELALDLLILDEAHMLKSRKAARTVRVLRYVAEFPETRLCAWSGTLTARTLEDYAHLLALALGEGSPLPLDPDEVVKWARAVDPSDFPAPPGALAKLGTPVRRAVRRRVLETRGFISTGAGALPPAELHIIERDPGPVPHALVEHIDHVTEFMERPDGEELLTALEVAACVQQLTCGFFYRWRFPDAPDPKLVDRWFKARKAWGREMRERLKRPGEHMDSPKLLANAAQRHEERYRCGPTCRGDRCQLDKHLPTWQSDHWAAWRDIKDSVRHETEAVWVDDYLARDAAALARERTVVVWYEHGAFGRKVAELSGAPRHGGGPGAEARILAERGDRSIVASVASHGTGRNGLQFRFAEQLVTCPSPDGQRNEQLLGRLHRAGQAADRVTTHVYRHTAEFAMAWDRAFKMARASDGDLQRMTEARVGWK